MNEKIKCFSRIFHAASLARKPHRLSQVLNFPEAIPKEKSALSSCKSLKLMLSKGYVKHVSPGVFNLMPLAVRSFEKLCKIVDSLMIQVDGQKVMFPTLIQESLMKTSGRWDTIDNLFKLSDRSSFNYCLGPTHEEIATSLMSKIYLSYKHLPVRFYQISSKFRDEMNPKLGLLRGREFVMKDMYTFDASQDAAKFTYEAVCNIYEELFNILGIRPIKVKADSGDIGGDWSHEYHFPSVIGEDELLYCPKCYTGINTELASEEHLKCESCQNPLEKCTSIEVGHAFLLGTKYSEAFQAMYNSESHKNEYYQMGCYGLGLTRILAASVEYLSDSDNIRWPTSVAPYLLSIIPPKKGSKEESVSAFGYNLAESLNEIDWLSSNVVIDDRTSFTIGKRVQEASMTGIPYAIVVGKSVQEDVPKFEVIDVYNNKTYFLTHYETISYFKNLVL